MTTTQQIDDPSIHIRPSSKLLDFLNALEDGPPSLKSKRPSADRNRCLLTDKERAFLNALPPSEVKDAFPDAPRLARNDSHGLLNLDDVSWLQGAIKTSQTKVYFHELFEGSEIVLPKNGEVPRNPELDRRCKILRAQQQNAQYKAMTKNVDSVRQRHPEDTIAYQMKQLNRHLIAVVQFLVSVAAGFAFGFIGLELLVGTLDFGFRILLGIMCALVIALAELYFLAKKLNDDLSFEANVKVSDKSSKIN